MYKLSSASDLNLFIDNGWFPAYFFIEEYDEDGDHDPQLYVAFVCNWRLDDGKLRFIRIRLVDIQDPMATISSLETRAKAIWDDDLTRRGKDAIEEINRISAKQK